MVIKLIMEFLKMNNINIKDNFKIMNFMAKGN